MTTELICADFKSKSRKYTKRPIERDDDSELKEAVPFGGSGIDGMPYVAPDRDPA